MRRSELPVGQVDGAPYTTAAMGSRVKGGFRAPAPIQDGRLQTLLSFVSARGFHDGALTGEPFVVDAGVDETGCDDGVRLLGYFNRGAHRDGGRGLVISLHGWEGCSHAPYNMLITQRLLAEGFDVVRLNLRDHGPGFHADPHALNRGLFLGTLLHESMEAVRRVADLAADRPVYLFGPSMGGNFVLRMAIAHRTAPIRNLRQVVAINPSINPGRAVDALDRDFMFRRYFRARWLASLWAKQRLFPDLYDFSGVEQHDTVRGMTEWLVKRYGLFATADEYFASYRVKGDDLVGVTAPTAIITAADDPVIPVADFYALAPDPNLLVQIHPTGGHCGYVDLAPFGHRLPDLILDVMCS